MPSYTLAHIYVFMYIHKYIHMCTYVHIDGFIYYYMDNIYKCIHECFTVLQFCMVERNSCQKLIWFKDNRPYSVMLNSRYLSCLKQNWLPKRLRTNRYRKLNPRAEVNFHSLRSNHAILVLDHVCTEYSINNRLWETKATAHRRIVLAGDGTHDKNMLRSLNIRLAASRSSRDKLFRKDFCIFGTCAVDDEGISINCATKALNGFDIVHGSTRNEMGRLTFCWKKWLGFA